MLISKAIKKELLDFLQSHRNVDLLTAYLFYLERTSELHPSVFPPNKTIYKSAEDAVKKLEKEDKVWRETEIKIGYGPPSVNEQTKKIYICPFTGKVFADNTHPNPQDAIYDWVSKCKENKERLGGVRVKRFFVSEDQEVIKNYIKPRKAPISKKVFSSSVSGKLYHTKEAIIKDFKKNYLKSMTLIEVQNQNRFELEEEFLAIIQEQLQEEKITRFVEELAEEEAFHHFVTKWIETEEE